MPEDIIIRENDAAHAFAVYFKKWEGYNLKFLGVAYSTFISEAIWEVAEKNGLTLPLKRWVTPPQLKKILCASVDGGYLLALGLTKDESAFSKPAKEWLASYKSGKMIESAETKRMELSDIKENEPVKIKAVIKSKVQAPEAWPDEEEPIKYPDGSPEAEIVAIAERTYYERVSGKGHREHGDASRMTTLRRESLELMPGLSGKIFNEIFLKAGREIITPRGHIRVYKYNDEYMLKYTEGAIDI